MGETLVSGDVRHEATPRPAGRVVPGAADHARWLGWGFAKVVLLAGVALAATATLDLLSRRPDATPWPFLLGFLALPGYLWIRPRLWAVERRRLAAVVGGERPGKGGVWFHGEADALRLLADMEAPTPAVAPSKELERQRQLYRRAQWLAAAPYLMCLAGLVLLPFSGQPSWALVVTGLVGGTWSDRRYLWSWAQWFRGWQAESGVASRRVDADAA